MFFFSKKRKKCGGSRRYRHPSGPAGLCPTPGQMARETRRLISTPLNQHFLLETTPNNGHNNKSNNNNNNETNLKKSPKEKKGEKMDIRPSHFRKDFVLIKMMSSDFPISLFQIENVLFPASSWLWSGSTGFFYRVLPSFPFKVRVEYERRSFFVCLGAFWFLPLEKKTEDFSFLERKKRAIFLPFPFPRLSLVVSFLFLWKTNGLASGVHLFCFGFFFGETISFPPTREMTRLYLRVDSFSVVSTLLTVFFFVLKLGFTGVLWASTEVTTVLLGFTGFLSRSTQVWLRSNWVLLGCTGLLLGST